MSKATYRYRVTMEEEEGLFRHHLATSKEGAEDIGEYIGGEYTVRKIKPRRR